MDYDRELLTKIMFLNLGEMNDAVTLTRDILEEEIHFKHIFDFLSNYKFLQYNSK